MFFSSSSMSWSFNWAFASFIIVSSSHEPVVCARVTLHLHGKVRPLHNEMDELVSLTQEQREYQACSIVVFVGTRLTTPTLDVNALVVSRRCGWMG